LLQSPRNRWRSCSGAVTRKSFVAGWRPASWPSSRSDRLCTQGPDHLHASAVAALGHARRLCGQNRSRGALGVRRVGLLEVAPRASPPVLFGRCTSSTSIPLALKWRVSLRPRSCLYLLPSTPAHLRGPKNPAPNGGASPNPLGSLARSTGPSACPGAPRPQPRGSLQMRVHTPRITATSVSGISAPIVLTSQAPLDVALTSTRGAGENGRMCCEGSGHGRGAPMRSRRCSGLGRPSSDTKASGRGVTSKAPFGPMWKEGQAAPRRRPQPSSRILTAWKGNSRKFRHQ
jgi:hypothetical protein